MVKNIEYNGLIFYIINEFNDYYISKCGKVLSTKKYNNTNRRILKCGISQGYELVTFIKKDKRYNKKIHRLVAIRFIENPYNKPCINHIDGNKTNNNISNLEWCTYSENELHSYKFLNKSSNKTNLGKFGKYAHRKTEVLQYDLNNKFIKLWDSIQDIKREFNFSSSAISNCCQGYSKTSNGFIWKYKK